MMICELFSVFLLHLFVILSHRKEPVLQLDPSRELIYLTTNVMFRHKSWSRRSPQPPLPLRIFCFLITLATVSIRFFGYNWPAFVATLITCWTFEITWFDSQLFFLWWTPLMRENIWIASSKKFIFIINSHHSPMWNTLGPRTTIAYSFFLRHWWLVCCNDQSQL